MLKEFNDFEKECPSKDERIRLFMLRAFHRGATYASKQIYSGATMFERIDEFREYTNGCIDLHEQKLKEDNA